jgi:cell division protease FtsH
VVLDLADMEGRKQILDVHKKNKPFEDNVNWEKVARRTVGFSGADLENMLNEAAILAARQNKTKISMDDLEEAATKVKMGPQKKRLQSDLDKKMTAYHETGHAIVTHELPNMDPVHRISIVSRGMSLGHTLIPPTADRLHETKAHLTQQIAAMLGGRAAEELVFEDISTGASSDISTATQIAREMVTEYGMSSLGPINFDNEMKTAMGRFYTEPIKLSEAMLTKIDGEVKQIIDDGLKLAVSILKKNRKLLDEVSKRLIEIETMDGEEFERLMGHQKVALAKASTT